jgi:hypothetical protein
MVDNRDIGDSTRRRNRVDGGGGCLGGPDEILVGCHSRRTINRHVRYAVEAVLRAEAAVQGKVDDLG